MLFKKFEQEQPEIIKEEEYVLVNGELVKKEEGDNDDGNIEKGNE